MQDQRIPSCEELAKPVTWLRGHRERTERAHSVLGQAERRWSTARLVSFAGAIVAGYGLRGEALLSMIAVTVMLAVFWLTVRRHQAAKARRELAGRTLVMINESVRRCTEWLCVIRSGDRPIDAEGASGDVGTVLDDGRTWTLTDQESDDVDLYAAPIGLFGVLNRVSTPLGAHRLRDLLEHPMLDRAHIASRQGTIRWLDEHPTERIRIMAAAAVLRNRDAMLNRLVAAIRGASALPHPGMMKVMRLWALPSFLITLAVIVGIGLGELRLGYLLFLLLLVNGFLYARARTVLNRCLHVWRDIGPAACGYAHVANEAAERLPHDGELGCVQGHLAKAASPSILPSLCRRIPWSESGGMMHTLCNLVFFFDVHIAKSILGKVLPNRQALLSGFAAVADVEALCSLACFAFESRAGGAVCYPELSNDGGIEMRQGRHPLILPQAVIGNDVELSPDARLWVITGPNMAGKSTLLRMVGISSLLGQLGTTVTADAMIMTPIRLITDLRTRDNLARHESYFLAEVRQLRRMVDPVADGAPILGLIDEPFRGTNSDEQVAASLAVVDHLLRLPHLFFVATHEYRLTEWADSRGSARNVHFHEELGEQGMVFDYRLRPGPAVARNALDVLAQARFPSALVENARRWLVNNSRPRP